jgi:hypothetical protein
MAISTYAELQTAVANWVDRADIGSRIPEFISIAESRINRRLRCREQEAEASVSLTGGTRTAALPNDFSEVRRLYLDSSPIRWLEYIDPNEYWRRYVSSTTSKPAVFTIEGTNLVFGPIPDSSYTAKLQYYRTLPALSTSAHGVFVSNPDLYLYGALTATEPFLKNDKRFGLWKSQFDEIMIELETQSRKIQGPPMRIRDDYNPL